MLGFREVELDDAELIFEWRTSERVSRYMLSDISRDFDLHQKWLKDSFRRPDYYHWIITYGKNDIGLVNFSEWDRLKRTTKWGFYIGDTRFLGLGGFVPPFFHNFAFQILEVERVFADVVAANTSTTELHLSQGYVVLDGSPVPNGKNGLELDVILLALSKKKFMASKLSRLATTFPMNNWMT